MRRGWRWAALGLVLAATTTGLLGWRAYRPEPPAAAAMPPASMAQASAPWGPVAMSTLATPRGELPLAAVSRPAASMPGTAGPAKEFVEVCGIGPVRRSELEPKPGQPSPAWLEALERQSEQEMAAMQQRLAAGSLKQRVAVAALRSDAGAAAQLAASTDDAQVYHMALRACRKDTHYRQLHASLGAVPPDPAASDIVTPEMPAPGPWPQACTALSLERLESLAPDDAWPWLARLGDSASRRDEAGVSQALYQIAQRRRLSPHLRALSNEMAEIVGDEPAPGTVMALVAALGVHMVHSDGDLFGVTRACSDASLRDANRRQLCEQVARRMPDMLHEAIDLTALRVLEKRLGWPPSSQAPSREDMNRALVDMGNEGARWMAEPSCANFARMGRLTVALGRGGELAWVRARLKASPSSAPR